MPLSDMADLHVSEFPAGEGSLANGNVEQPVQDKGSFSTALCRRGGTAEKLQQNHGGKNKAAVGRIAARSRVQTRVVCCACAVA